MFLFDRWEKFKKLKIDGYTVDKVKQQPRLVVATKATQSLIPPTILVHIQLWRGFLGKLCT
jgi:hypothetical protein